MNTLERVMKRLNDINHPTGVFIHKCDVSPKTHEELRVLGLVEREGGGLRIESGLFSYVAFFPHPAVGDDDMVVFMTRVTRVPL